MRWLFVASQNLQGIKTKQLQKLDLAHRLSDLGTQDDLISFFDATTAAGLFTVPEPSSLALLVTSPTFAIRRRH